MNIDALARYLANDALQEYLYSDYYYGGIESPEEYDAELVRRLPTYREKAIKLLKIAEVL